MRDVVNGLLYLYISGRVLFFTSCSDIASPDHVAYAVAAEANAHVEGTGIGPIEPSSLSEGTPMERVIETLKRADNQIQEYLFLYYSLPCSSNVDSGILSRLPHNDEEAKQLLQLKSTDPLPFMVFLDEVDKLEAGNASSLFTLFQDLISRGYMLLTFAGNNGSAIHRDATKSSLVLDWIRLSPILHPTHIEELARGVGVRQGRPGCVLYEMSNERRGVELIPEAWNFFLQSAFKSSGIPVILSCLCQSIKEGARAMASRFSREHLTKTLVHLSVVEAATLQAVPQDIKRRYKPEAIHRALALSSLPLVGSDIIDSSRDGEENEARGMTVSGSEEQGFLYLCDFDHETEAPGRLLASLPNNSETTSEVHSVDGERENMTPNLDCDPYSLVCQIGRSTVSCTSSDNDGSAASAPAVSVLCPALLCDKLPSGFELLRDLPAWASGLQSALTPFGTEEGLRCEQEVAGLLAARAALATQILKTTEIPLWRLMPTGVLGTGEAVGIDDLEGDFSKFVFETEIGKCPSSYVLKSCAAIEYRCDRMGAINSVVNEKEEINKGYLGCTPNQIAKKAHSFFTDSGPCSIVVNGKGAQGPDLFVTAKDITTKKKIIIGIDVKTNKKASCLAQQWTQFAALSKLSGWELPSYLISLRARLSRPSKSRFPEKGEYITDLKSYGGLFTKEECEDLADKAFERHILMGASFFGPSWSCYLTSAKARSEQRDLFEMGDAPF